MITDQTAEIGASVNAAIDKAVAELDADEEKLQSARESIESMSPAASGGFLSELADIFDTAVGIASGIILGALIMYYLLKDGTKTQTVDGRSVRSVGTRTGGWLRHRLLPDSS